MQAHGLHRAGPGGGASSTRSSPHRRAPPRQPPPARAPTATPTPTRLLPTPPRSSPPPIVEWCPAGAAASVDEEESESCSSSGRGARPSSSSEPDSWRRPLEGWAPATGSAAAASPSSLPPVVALGKFDALHRGHQALARAAARECKGAPVLLSFSGMAAVLGWAPRRPLVARQDRARVLDLWARELAAEGVYGEEAAEAARRETEAMEEAAAEGAGRARRASGGNNTNGAATTTPTLTTRPFPPIRQRYVPFASVRSLPPEAFVDLLRGQMRAVGAVAGANFRFGFKAAGDSAALSRLCAERGMRCAIVGLLMRRGDQVGQQGDGNEEQGAVSSSRVREQLAAGRVEAAARSLGRPHRVVFVVVGAASDASSSSTAEFLPLATAEALRNQPPAEGEYTARVSCYPLPEAGGGGGGGSGGGDGASGRRQQQQHQDACLLELEARQRAWIDGSGGEEQQPPARVFFEETRVRVDAEGGVAAEAGVARRCLGGGGGVGAANDSFVLAVDFLGRSGGRWTPEVRTEDED